jgi:hypothetical protein
MTTKCSNLLKGLEYHQKKVKITGNLRYFFNPEFLDF